MEENQLSGTQMNLKPTTMSELAPLRGLILCGGYSRRMGVDKATLVSPRSGKPMVAHLSDLLERLGIDVYLSLRHGQAVEGVAISPNRWITDRAGVGGPLAGILGAMDAVEASAWLVLACDLPLLDQMTLERLFAGRDGRPFVAFANAEHGFPEPLCTIYEPEALLFIETRLRAGDHCPKDIIAHSAVPLLKVPFKDALGNANTREEWDRLSQIANQ